MAVLPEFTHIHCSSRFDRSAQSLDFDLETWRQSSSLITLTEVDNDQRAAQMRAVGWGYYNVVGGSYGDDCGMCWDTDVWKRLSGTTLKMSGNYERAISHNHVAIYSITCVLQSVRTGHKLLVSCSHFPAHVEGQGGFRTDLAQWQSRKLAYMAALTSWSTHVKAQRALQNIDATLIVADWNLNLKAQWFRQILMGHWGNEYDIAWRNMPTAGGTVHGGTTSSPGQTHVDHIIDGSLFNGLDITGGPTLMGRVSSSDHRPYTEKFQFASAAGHPAKAKATDKKKKGPGEVGQSASVYVNGYGNVFHGDAWWGFGDTMVDEMYFSKGDEVATGEAGGEVL
jgi:hypothetical protein